MIPNALTVLLAVFSFGLPPAAEAKAPPRPDVVVGPESSGQEVSLVPGQKLFIKLPGNPTTGYQWTMARLEGAALLQSGGLEYRPSAGSAGMVGSGGEYSVSFRAVSTGTAELRLDYGRSWEKSPERSFSLRAVCAAPPADIAAVFLCPDGSRIRARFLLEEDAVRLSFPGRKVTLKRGRSASGARYVGKGIEFWDKGDDARVTEGGREYSCRARK
jgi:inhibitor of cysteine peptidase